MSEAAKTPSRRTRTKISAATLVLLLRDVICAIVLAVALAIGVGELIVFENDSKLGSFAGLSIGGAVQVALFPLANLARMICQLWFTYNIVNGGMPAERMFSSWSLLYSGGFRGIEDLLGGASPIALVLLCWFAAEACIIGAIGTLYTVQPTVTTRAVGAWPSFLRDSANATYDNNVANDLSQGNLFGAICSPLQQAATMAQPAQISCSPDATYCRGAATGALHPLIAGSFGLPYRFPFTDIDVGDVVEGDVLAATVTVSCNSTANFTLWENEAPPEWAFAEAMVDVTFPTRSGGLSTVSAGTGYGIIYQAAGLPEIGVLPLAATEAGGYMSVMYTKDFPGDFRGFQQFQDPIRGRRLGLTCSCEMACVG
ncbi:hypothetical protein HDU86_003046 [Geranomyces michiganensis]|nr:hypothetical protein HDU86_003046 [Geranomyces michiganensis]